MRNGRHQIALTQATPDHWINERFGYRDLEVRRQPGMRGGLGTRGTLADRSRPKRSMDGARAGDAFSGDGKVRNIQAIASGQGAQRRFARWRGSGPALGSAGCRARGGHRGCAQVFGGGEEPDGAGREAAGGREESHEWAVARREMSGSVLTPRSRRWWVCGLGHAKEPEWKGAIRPWGRGLPRLGPVRHRIGGAPLAQCGSR